jgi:hypothetical protein
MGIKKVSTNYVFLSFLKIKCELAVLTPSLTAARMNTGFEESLIFSILQTSANHKRIKSSCLTLEGGGAKLAKTEPKCCTLVKHKNLAPP